MIKLLIADDHEVVAGGVSALLTQGGYQVTCVKDGVELINTFESYRPDLVLSDISMPKKNGLECSKLILEKESNAKIILLTMFPDVAYAVRALKIGVKGYCLKSQPPSDLLFAVQSVLANKTYITPSMAESVDISMKEECDNGGFGKLTPRQGQILQLLSEGRGAKSIAAELNITSKTVEFHKYKMVKLLALKSPKELVPYALKRGLVTL